MAWSPHLDRCCCRKAGFAPKRRTGLAKPLQSAPKGCRTRSRGPSLEDMQCRVDLYAAQCLKHRPAVRHRHAGLVGRVQKNGRRRVGAQQQRVGILGQLGRRWRVAKLALACPRMNCRTLHRHHRGFLYRNSLEARHWVVLGQDRMMLESMEPDANQREHLYEHDVGLSRLRKLKQSMAQWQLG